jgi:hypothetical protein
VVRRVCFQHLTEGPRDLWVFCLASSVPRNVDEYPPEIIVEVRNDTGEITLFGAGRREER